MAPGWFVDFHSHVCPSGDDGAQSMREGVDLCLAAARHGTRTLFATPHVAALLDLDPHRYALEGLDVVLMEVPFTGSADLLVALAEHTEAEGLTPLIAHPERTEAVLERPALAEELAERGWPLQVNATSLLGYHGPEPEELGWRLLRDGLASAVASDGHRATRPARLDEAWELVHAELGAAARPLFDGSAIGLDQPLEQPHRVL